MRKKPAEDVYFWQFKRRYLDEVVELHKLSTYTNYKSILENLNVEFGHLRMSQITRKQIQEYLTRRAKEVSAVTVRQYWVVLLGLLTYAEAEGLLELPNRPRLPKHHRKPQAWRTLEQMQTLIARSTGPLHILIMLLAETGCRIGEALSLQTKHIDPERRELYIRQTVYMRVIGTPKSPASERIVALSDQLCYALNAFRVKANPDYYLFRDKFGRPWTPDFARDLIDELCDRIKFPRTGFHAFRRGNITVLAKTLKVPAAIIAQRVGHEVGKAFGTLADYIQVVEEADREYVPAIAAAFYGEGEKMNPNQNQAEVRHDVRYDAHAVNTAAYHNHTQPFMRCRCGFETSAAHTDWVQVSTEFEQHVQTAATAAA